MKKRILNITLIGAMLFSTPFAFNSCKDYDDDIESLSNRIDNLDGQAGTLKAQVSALESALNSAKAEIAAAATAAANAQKTADEAKQAAADAVATAERLAGEAKAEALKEAEKKIAEAVAAASEADRKYADEAAAKAKAEAITEVLAQVNELLARYQDQLDKTNEEIAKLKLATDEELAKISGRIDAIDSSINQFNEFQKTTTAELAKLNEAIELQKAALEEYKKLTDGKLAAIVNDVKDIADKVTKLETSVGQNTENIKKLTDQIAEVEDDLKDVNTKIEAINSDLDEIRTRLDGIDTNLDDIASDIEAINTKLSELSIKITNEVNGAVNTLSAIFKGRLTSVTLVPTAYVGGIPCIDFKTAQYQIMQINAKTGYLEVKPNTNAVNVNNSETFAYFRLNPATVQASDITKPSFVNTTATVRASEKPILDVTDYSFVDGMLKVNVTRAAGYTEEFKTGNVVDIVALKVPIAKEHYIAGESAQDAVVYSEYSRVAETFFHPEIAKNPIADPSSQELWHFYDKANMWASPIGKNIDFYPLYGKEFNLKEVVGGCKASGNNHIFMDNAELESYGFKLEFRIPNTGGIWAYKGNDVLATDQQKFGKVTLDGIVTWTDADQGREPIVEVRMIDTKHNNNLVDVRYFKLHFSKIDIAPVDLGTIFSFSEMLNCNDAYTKTLTEAQIKSTIFNNSKLSKLGLTWAEFQSVYSKIEYVWSDNINEKATTASAQVTLKPTANATFTVAQEGIGDLKGKDKTVTCQVTLSDPAGLHADIIFTYSLTVKYPTAIPGVYNIYEQFWSVPNSVIRVAPVQYNTVGAQATCVYNYDLWSPFMLNPAGGYSKNTILKDLTECSTWDIQFIGKQTINSKQYVAEDKDNTPSVDGNYTLSNNKQPAIKLVWDQGHSAFGGKPAKPSSSTFVTVNNNDAGLNLIGQKVKVGVWATINPYNTVEVKKYDLEIVKPLVVRQNLTNGEWIDGLVSGSAIDCSKAFTMVDFRGYTVAKANPGNSELEMYAADLYKYYGVNDPVWDIDNARIGINKTTGKVDDTLTATTAPKISDAALKDKVDVSITQEGDKLIFKNNTGHLIEKECNVFVPVTVSHKWGVENKVVTIKLLPGSIISRSKKR